MLANKYHIPARVNFMIKNSRWKVIHFVQMQKVFKALLSLIFSF